MMKTKKALTITTGRWVRVKNTLSYECLGRDVLGNKYTFMVESREMPGQSKEKTIVSKHEWNRIQLEMKAKIDKKYAEILESLNRAYEKRNSTEKQRSYYVDKRGRYIHESGKEITGEELKILKELEAEGKI
jgi:hypothetical protein